jgi:hypothetical protein
MTIKSAAFLALIGMLLVTIVLVLAFIIDVSNLANGAVPAITVLKSLIYAFASLTVTLFFFIFHKSQS